MYIVVYCKDLSKGEGGGAIPLVYEETMQNSEQSDQRVQLRFNLAYLLNF